MRLLIRYTEQDITSLPQTFSQNVQPKTNYEETSDKPKLEGMLESTWIVVFKSFKDKNDKHLCKHLQLTEETRQRNVCS